MNSNFKLNVARLGLVLLLVTPLSALAATSNQTRSGGVGEVICQRLDAISSKLVERADSNKTLWGQKRIDVLKKITTNRQEAIDRLFAARALADANRKEAYNKLSAQATTTSQKQALNTFKSAVEAAVKARKTAVDNALKTYQEGVLTLANSRNDASLALLTKLRNDIKAAFAQAKADCAAGKDTQMIKTNLLSSMRTAREQFTAERQKTNDLKSQLEALKSARNTAIRNAMQEFKQALERAKQDLKAAFNTATSTPE